MRILFSHCNFPAQFRRLAPALANRGNDVVFLAKSKEWHAPEPDGFRLVVTATHREGGSDHLHPYLRRFDQAVLEGQGVFRACMKLKAEGWEPDLVITHVGFGNGLYIRDAFLRLAKSDSSSGITTVLTRMLISYSQGPLVGIKHFGCAPGMRRP